MLTSLASPVAGAFLAMAMLAWAIAGPRRTLPVVLCLLALAPIAFLSIAFPEGGSQPFVASAFWPALVGVIIVGLAIPPERRTLRIGALLYALVLIGSFLVPSAVGGNADRLGALIAGPVAACALVGAAQPWRRWLLVALIVPLTYWQANAPVTDYVSTVSNRATHASYYAPLLAELARLGVGYGRVPARIEVVPTVDHWEARYVAPAVMIARGWERQLDRYRNGLFYSSAPLTPARGTVRWLDAQAISYVALPDASLDYSAKAEARLLRGQALTGPRRRPAGSLALAALAPVRGAARAATGAVGGPSTQATTESFSLRAAAPGDYLVLIRFTPYWAVARGRGCVAQTAGGWTSLRAEGTRGRCTS